MEPRKEWKGKRNYNCKFQHRKKQLGVVEKSLKASRTGSTFFAKVKFFHHDCWSVGGTMCESSLFQYLETEISGNCQWICLVLENRRG